MTAPAEVTERQLAQAVLSVLKHAPVRGHFTSLSTPVWDGWATVAMVQWKLPHLLVERAFEDADKSDPEPEAWYYVEPVMHRLARAGLLERTSVRPWRYVRHIGKAEIEVPAFRLPGDAGYCLWRPRRPLDPTIYDVLAGAGARPRPTPERLASQRQVAQLMAELADSDSEIPPYVAARIAQYATHKSGGRALR